jgi:hypothetical protein
MRLSRQRCRLPGPMMEGLVIDAKTEMQFRHQYGGVKVIIHVFQMHKESYGNKFDAVDIWLE